MVKRSEKFDGESYFHSWTTGEKGCYHWKKARELDIHYKIKKSHLWAFDGERYQPVDDISELPDYQRRQQKSLQTVQNGTPVMNNKRNYAFSPDMDATNNGNDIPMNKKQNMYGVSFQQNKSYASKN